MPVVRLDQVRIARARLVETVLAHKTKEICWDNVNLQDPEERARFTDKKETPPDMRPGSKCTFPG